MEGPTTRRTFLASGVLAGLAGLGTGMPRASAGEVDCGVPSAVATARAEGTTFEPIGFGTPVSTPGYGLSVYRFSLPPGEVVPPHRHPGATILAVERGELGYTLLRGSASIQRTSVGSEELTPESEAILQPGDSLFYDADAAHTARNPGATPVLVLAVTLLAPDRPATIPTDEHGMEEGARIAGSSELGSGHETGAPPNS
jgi:quercetin dioxygenase-like cupin family protein